MLFEGDYMGMDYSQKGFSTDSYFKVRLGNGEEVMDEVSLKKDKKVNLLNSGTGKFSSWNPSTDGTDIDPKILAEQELQRLNDGIKKNRDKLETLLKGNSKEAKAIKEAMKSKKVNSIDDFYPPTNRDQRKVCFVAMNALAKGAYSDKSGKVTDKGGDPDATKWVEGHIQAIRDYATASTKAIVENETLKQGMLEEIKSEFPLKSVADGEETMAIGDMSLDKKTITDIFGTDDFSKIVFLP